MVAKLVMMIAAAMVVAFIAWLSGYDADDQASLDAFLGSGPTDPVTPHTMSLDWGVGHAAPPR